MKINTLHIYICLLLLTLGTYIQSFFPSGAKSALPGIVLVAWSIKFLLVAFQFMDLKKAHLFWKLSLTFYLLIVVSILLLLMYFL